MRSYLKATTSAFAVAAGLLVGAASLQASPASAATTTGSGLTAAATASQSAPWPTDWANSNFRAAYGSRYTGTTFNGVASCGNAYPNNYQGRITYDGVLLDSVGFQCVEVVARYLFYTTGHHPPIVQDASDYAYYIGADYGYNVYPSGLYGVTHTYTSSLRVGQIVSMWSSSDEVGHVGVVTNVNVNNGNGTITIMDENGSAAGHDTITVSGGAMEFAGYNDYQWTTNLPYSSPSVQYPAHTYGPEAPTSHSEVSIGTRVLRRAWSTTSSGPIRTAQRQSTGLLGHLRSEPASTTWRHTCRPSTTTPR